MDLKAQILKDTFENSFDIVRFEKFIKEFFNKIEIIAPNRKIPNYLSEFAYTISGHIHIANYTDIQNKRIAILAIELKSGRNVERARSTQRNFVSKLISKSGYDAAIVAFFISNDTKWRLSFVRLDQEWISGGKVKTTITPAKRYSYLVGDKEPCHTAKEQLYPIFRNEDFNPTLDKIEEAFSVETVTDEFFQAYKLKYLDLREHLESNKDFNQEALKHQFSSEQFAKKMMGQLAFLYFLQKKGWLGVKVVPLIIDEKQYKNAYYRSNASRDVISKIFEQKSSGEYRLKTGLLSSDGFTDEEANILASCFTPEPWGTGTKSFIRDLFNHCIKQPNKNFFEDYLEPLFYEALRINRGENQYYKRFNCKIPFLNGGLFDPLENYDWKHSSFNIPNSMFSNRQEKGEHNCDGILDVFERYNFTMNEDEPLEREVAVDPEMLGKIFENLLEITDRKSKGAFYTPREIVHYMCQESLINYLITETALPYDDVRQFILFGEIMKDEDCNKNIDIYNDSQRKLPMSVFSNLRRIDKALESIKVADPAVGSGAFPLGMISEIVRARNNITDYYAIQIVDENKKLQSSQRAKYRESRCPYIMKWNTIKNSIYAVDIEASAVDIAKLRLWLSLVVDEDLEPTFDEKQMGITRLRDPNPLPNLDYNIMCGNSLIEDFEGIKLFDDTVLLRDTQERTEQNFQINFFQDHITNLTEHLFDMQDKLFGENNTENKLSLRRSIDKTIDDIIRTKLSRDGNTDGLTKYEESLKQKTKPYFLWKLEFAKIFKDKGGFDVVIGNPPYIKEYTNSKVFEKLKNSPYYQGKMDFWYFFACIGLDLLKPNGIQCYIAPNNWITNSGASILRNKIIDESQILYFVDFGNKKVFNSAAIQTMVYVLKKNNEVAQYSTKYSKLLLDKTSNQQLTNFLYQDEIPGESEKYSIDINRADNKDKFINFSRNDFKTISAKITSNSSFFNSDEIAQGIVCPQDVVNKKSAAILGHGFKVGDGVFVLTEEEFHSLNLKESEQKIIKPYYTSAELEKYFCKNKNLNYIIYSKSNMNSIINEYPNIKKHLDKFTEIITSSNAPYGLHRARDERFFIGQKIISIRKCKTPTFTFVEGDSYVSQTFNIIKTQRFHYSYLNALLNSQLVKFWLLNNGKLQGDIYQIDKEPLMQIPIKSPSEIEVKEIEKILNMVKNDKSSLNDNINELDKIIFKIYNLSDPEIEIVKKTINEV